MNKVELCEQVAKEYLTRGQEPSTPYEHSSIKNFTTFGLRVLGKVEHGNDNMAIIDTELHYWRETHFDHGVVSDQQLIDLRTRLLGRVPELC